MKIGARVYYDKQTGSVVRTIGPFSGTEGSVFQTTREQDFESYADLAERVPETIGDVQLDFDIYSEDFSEGGRVTQIDITTMKPLFTYPNTVDPETPQEPRPPLSAQVSALESETAALNLAIIDIWETLANGGAA
ncbi:hypothetical protein [Paenibacillus xylanilyticus]|uniref:hypothetical protein n=1 Tax=Paenibacillus xylanilyticus TaxID=248903 RepID=UPI003AAC580C